jgi:hypothetical protein
VTSSIASNCLRPSARTPSATSTGTPTTRFAIRTRSAIASRYRYASSTSVSLRACHASSSWRSVATIRETALFDSGAAFSSGDSAPRMRRVLPPERYTAAIAALTSGIRRS